MTIPAHVWNRLSLAADTAPGFFSCVLGQIVDGGFTLPPFWHMRSAA